MVQWKTTPNERKRSYWRYTHFALNHDYGKKGNKLLPCCGWWGLQCWCGTWINIAWLESLGPLCHISGVLVSCPGQENDMNLKQHLVMAMIIKHMFFTIPQIPYCKCVSIFCPARKKSSLIFHSPFSNTTKLPTHHLQQFIISHQFSNTSKSSPKISIPRWWLKHPFEKYARQNGSFPQFSEWKF